MSAVELGVNTETRRVGQVAVSVIADQPGFGGVPVATAREFAMRILVACRDAEDAAAPPTEEEAP